MASDNLTGLELAKLRAEFNLFRQASNKNVYSNLIVFIKNVLFKGDVKTERNGVQYNLVPSYTETASLGSSGVAGGAESTWVDWDLSSYLPANAIRVDIALVNQSATPYVAGVRENGSALDRFNHISNDSQYFLTVNLDDDLIIERYATHGDITFSIIGYYI